MKNRYKILVGKPEAKRPRKKIIHPGEIILK
jgi:hypothetical protein